VEFEIRSEKNREAAGDSLRLKILVGYIINRCHLLYTIYKERMGDQNQLPVYKLISRQAEVKMFKNKNTNALPVAR
jgi:hypothetical protein